MEPKIGVDPEPVPLVADKSGAWRVAGTRVTLETLVAAFERGDSPEEIHEQYPSVPLGDVYAVLTYYVRNRDSPSHTCASGRVRVRTFSPR